MSRTVPAADFPVAAAEHLSPGTRAWRRFRRHRRGYRSLLIFAVLFGLSLFAELLSNDKPLLVHYQGGWYVPFLVSYPETTFDGDFETEADYNDPYVQQLLGGNGGWVLYAPNRHSFNSINYYAERPNPAPPSRTNLLGTDDRGRDGETPAPHDEAQQAEHVQRGQVDDRLVQAVGTEGGEHEDAAVE